MSATDRRPAHREATSADSARAVGRPGTSHAGEAGDAIACLDVLAAHLRARGWTTYINTPAGRLASLFVQDPHHRGEAAPPARRADRVAAAQTPHQARPATPSAVRAQVSLQPG